MHAAQPEFVKPTKFAEQPRPLHFQLASIRQNRGIGIRCLSETTGVSVAALISLEDGRASLDLFSRVLRALGLVIDVRSWDHQKIVALDDTLDPAKFCHALREHYRAVRPLLLVHRFIPDRDSNAVEDPSPTVTLRQVIKYMKHIDMTARIIPRDERN